MLVPVGNGTLTVLERQYKPRQSRMSVLAYTVFALRLFPFPRLEDLTSGNEYKYLKVRFITLLIKKIS